MRKTRYPSKKAAVKQTEPVAFELPVPPSVNQLWRSHRGRVHRSQAYKKWQAAAGWELLAQRPRHVPGDVFVRILAGKTRRKRDLDNLFKATLDLLVTHELIEDDSRIHEIYARWSPAVPGGRVAVSIGALQ